jgi:hypothetical protein
MSTEKGVLWFFVGLDTFIAMGLFPLAFQLELCTIVQTFTQHKGKQHGNNSKQWWWW